MANPVEKRIRIDDPAVMRALAHPARLAILEQMHNGREGTATEFAEVCGLSPSATSYHLRALARTGLVEQAPGRGDGRERVWRSVGGSLEINSGPAADPETQRAERELVGVLLARVEARARVWLARWPQETQDWYEAAAFTDGTLLATQAELKQLNAQVEALLRPYWRTREDPPPDARRIAVTYRAFPLPPAAE